MAWRWWGHKWGLDTTPWPSTPPPAPASAPRGCRRAAARGQGHTPGWALGSTHSLPLPLLRAAGAAGRRAVAHRQRRRVHPLVVGGLPPRGRQRAAAVRRHAGAVEAAAGGGGHRGGAGSDGPGGNLRGHGNRHRVQPRAALASALLGRSRALSAALSESPTARSGRSGSSGGGSDGGSAQEEGNGEAASRSAPAPLRRGRAPRGSGPPPLL